MARLELSPAAESDLDDIWLFIAQDHIVNADRYIDFLKEKAILVAGSPRMGKLRSELRPSLYSFPVDDYVLFYRIIENDEGIELARVLSASLELSRITQF